MEDTYDEFHIVELYRLTPEMIAWCNKSYGKPGLRWWMSNNRVYFRNEKDHLLFLLKWH